jgi:hypothetical protein
LLNFLQTNIDVLKSQFAITISGLIAAIRAISANIVTNIFLKNVSQNNNIGPLTAGNFGSFLTQPSLVEDLSVRQLFVVGEISTGSKKTTKERLE